MGWTFFHREPGQTNEAVFQHELATSGTIVVSGNSGKTFYCAFKPNDKPYVLALVFLTASKKDYFNFGYKDMDEGMGPVESECPAKVLDALSPIDEIYTGISAECATRWRERCRAALARKQARGKLAAGNKLVFPTPIRFTNGQSFQELVIRTVKPLRLVAPGNPYLDYRLSKDVLNTATVVREE